MIRKSKQSENKAYHYLNQALEFVHIIKQLINRNGWQSALKNPVLQNATLFCLKAIGTYVDIASPQLDIDFQQKKMPTMQQHFFGTLHYLRNHLIHHFHFNLSQQHVLNEAQLNLLSQFLNNIGQLEFFLTVIVNKKIHPDQFDLKGQKYKVFYSIHDFSEKLRKDNPKDSRNQIPQYQYLQGIVNAISAINLMLPYKELTKAHITDLRSNNPAASYYAVLNLLDNVAILGNPNRLGAEQYISDFSRGALFSINPDCQKFMRALGDDRNTASHETIIIPDDSVVDHVLNMRVVQKALLSDDLKSTSVKRNLFLELQPPNMPRLLRCVDVDYNNLNKGLTMHNNSR